MYSSTSANTKKLIPVLEFYSSTDTSSSTPLLKAIFALIKDYNFIGYIREYLFHNRMPAHPPETK